MCLAIPGKIIRIKEAESSMRMGVVSFGGTLREVNLVYVPDAGVDDFVIVHVGFAISVLDQKEAEQVFKLLDEINSD